ncbi:MAG: hypothetical protein FJY65_07020 [Calditrichaeota bacterium]|nr:hypothetical protein [Calditrichota bacterium]
MGFGRRQTGSHIVVADSVEIVITAFDESGLDSIRIFKNGFTPDLWRIASRPTTPLNDTLYTFTWNTLSDSDGVYALEARAYDKAGNAGISPTLTIRVQNNPPSDDRTPPDVWFEAPAPGATLRDTVRIVVGYFDESGVDSVQLVKDGEVIEISDTPPFNSLRKRGESEYFSARKRGERAFFPPRKRGECVFPPPQAWGECVFPPPLAGGSKGGC